MGGRLITARLVLSPWTLDDAGAALGAYGDADVARWLAPAMDRVPDLAAMRLVLREWVVEDARIVAPAGRWAMERRLDGEVIGGATLLPLPPDDEYEMGWQLHRQVCGRRPGTTESTKAEKCRTSMRTPAQVARPTCPIWGTSVASGGLLVQVPSGPSRKGNHRR